jgi:hypothetical protein
MADINRSDYDSYIINSINAQCHEYYPTCIHDVIITIIEHNIKINIFIQGEEIANYYKYHKIIIPEHFCKYICEQSNLN